MLKEHKIRVHAFASLTTLLILIFLVAYFLKASWIFFLILGIASVSTFGVGYWFHLKQEKLSEIKELSSVFENGTGLPIKFPFEELKLATDNFSSIVGQGGSGCVFRGKLRDGTHIAVKRVEGKERGEKEFRAEVAVIGCVQHMNLDHNKSHHTGGCLPWKVRVQVSIDVAKALAYLHNDCQSRILHLDVKPENILLDSNFRAIVSDFGLAKLMGKEESMVVTRIRGTRGYLAPEWILERGVSTKSDVYSYGMLLLEIIGGRRNVIMSSSGDRKGKSTIPDVNLWEYFPKTVFEKLQAGKIMEVVDTRVLEEGVGIDENEVRRLAYVALWCIQEKVKIRPSMGQVVDMLEGRLCVDEPPETKMFFHDLLLIEEKSQGRSTIKATTLQITQSPTGSFSTCFNPS